MNHYEITSCKAWERFDKSSRFVKSTACITALRVEGAPLMVNACQIKPHSICGINTVDNGLALCPNLHIAFDSGLFYLSDDYTVVVKDKLVETDTTYSLKKLEGRRIWLPKEERFWPGREWVRWIFTLRLNKINQ